MKRIRQSIVKTIGMLLTLGGIAVVFAACYGVLPQESEATPGDSLYDDFAAEAAADTVRAELPAE